MSIINKKHHKDIGKSNQKTHLLFLSLILWLFFSSAFATAPQVKQISVSVKQVKLQHFFQEIESKSTYKFSYRDAVVQNKKNVTIDATNEPVEAILNKVLPAHGLQYQIEGNSVIVTPALLQQGGEKKITGVVIDQTGEPVIGANVIEKGTTNGTITGVDGDFTLTVKPNAILQVSFIGYNNQEVAVTSKDHLNIKLMEDLQALDEVVVIGYGTTKRQDFTGSVSSVRLEDSPVALASNLNALEAIKGNVAGLDIGATNQAGGEPSMEMRGQKSISGSNQPLIVVDGIIYLGSLRDINPNDIASFDVLKDATSAAAYGSRSANGVIIITTKKGRSDKPVINFNASGSLQTWQYRPKLMNGDQWLESVMARNNSSDLTWLKPQEVANRDAGREIDWLDAITRTGWVQDYQVSVSGSGKMMNYYLSASYADNQGVIVGDEFDRINVLGKVNTDITDWLQVGVDAAFSALDYSGVAAHTQNAYLMPPYGVMYREGDNKQLERYPYTQSGNNPLWGVSNGSRDNIDERNNFRLNTYAIVKLPWMPNLSYRFNYSGNLSKDQTGNFYHESHYVREGAYDDASRYSPAAYQNLLAQANGNINNKTTGSWVVDHILNYKESFGKHSIDLTAVATRDRKTYKEIISKGSDYTANGNTTLGINGLQKATTQRVEQKNEIRSNIGYLGRLSYAYADRYFLTASLRRDGASVFGVNQKWGNFIAFGGAWRVTGEEFMKNFRPLNNLKVKVSWGKNGNQGLDPYGTLTTVINGASGGNSDYKPVRYEFANSSNILYGLYPYVLGNPDLGWESTQSWNIGFESAWLENRLFLDVDAYFSKTTNQIFDRNIPYMNGFKTMKSSMGQIDNTGLEITVRTVNVETVDLRWTTSLTYWMNRNKIAHLYGDDLDGDGKEDDDVSNSRFIGKPIGSIYGYVQDGIVQQEDVEYMKANGVAAGVPKYKDLNKDGKITAADRHILGYKEPNFKLNMSNSVTYKNWDLYVMLTGTFGGGNYYLKDNKNAYMINGSTLFNSNGIYIPWWTPENRSNIYPSAVFSGDGDRFQGLQNRGFVRLQDVTLAYTFREPWIEKIKMQGLKVFFTSKNLFTITHWEGGDPEQGTRVGDDKDVDKGNTLPVLTSFSLGAQISF